VIEEGFLFDTHLGSDNAYGVDTPFGQSKGCPRRLPFFQLSGKGFEQRNVFIYKGLIVFYHALASRLFFHYYIIDQLISNSRKKLFIYLDNILL
jgi:hypothetical protein